MSDDKMEVRRADGSVVDEVWAVTSSLEAFEQLRRPFPPEQVAQIHRGGGVVLDYVGHADVTMRLNEVDPAWYWEPFALDERGLPLITEHGLWIRLHVLGAHRIGFGDAGNKPPGPNALKEMIGDAIRNAAMRFGVATYLWSKSEAADELRGGGEQRPTRQVVPPLLQQVYDALSALTQHQRDQVRQWAEQEYAQPVDLPSYSDEQLRGVIAQARLAVAHPPA